MDISNLFFRLSRNDGLIPDPSLFHVNPDFQASSSSQPINSVNASLRLSAIMLKPNTTHIIAIQRSFGTRAGRNGSQF